jgi:muramoyltetrapeptide carboxypeptidase
MSPWCLAEKSEYIDIIAPSGAISPSDLLAIQAMLSNRQLRGRVPENIIGTHPFSAQTDAVRFALLKQALMAEDSTVIWCVRGGHGVSRLMPELISLPKPNKQKILIGFSDISSLHLWLNQAWCWPSIHGPGARQSAYHEIAVEDVDSLYQLMFSGLTHYKISGLLPLNSAAEQLTQVSGITAGGCISVLQTSVGTAWQLDGRNKILFLEDINEQAYRIDRALVHFVHAGLLNDVAAIVFGDFGERAEATKTMDWVLQEAIPDYLTAYHQCIPLFRLHGFGHGKQNKPLPFGVAATIHKQGACAELVFSAP